MSRCGGSGRAGTRGRVLSQLAHPRLPGDLDRGTGPAARQPCPRRGAGGRVLGPGDAAARPAEVRLLLRNLGNLPGEHRRGTGVDRRLGGATCRRHPGRRGAAAGEATADGQRDAAPVLRGLRDRGRRAVRRRPISAARELTESALGVGAQYAAQGLVRSNESVSALLFATARQVAADQKLLEPSTDLRERRKAFLHELRAILADMERVHEVSREQFYAREAHLGSGPRISADSTDPTGGDQHKREICCYRHGRPFRVFGASSRTRCGSREVPLLKSDSVARGAVVALALLLGAGSPVAPRRSPCRPRRPSPRTSFRRI